MSGKSIRFKRPLLKLSGEMFGGKDGFGFDRASLENFAKEVKAVVDACKERKTA